MSQKLMDKHNINDPIFVNAFLIAIQKNIGEWEQISFENQNHQFIWSCIQHGFIHNNEYLSIDTFFTRIQPYQADSIAYKRVNFHHMSDQFVHVCFDDQFISIYNQCKNTSNQVLNRSSCRQLLLEKDLGDYIKLFDFRINTFPISHN